MNAKQHAIAIAKGKFLQTGNASLLVKLALVQNVENDGCVYLENAYETVAGLLTKHQWAGYLSTLQQEGFYVPAEGRYNGYFGYVVQEKL